MADTTTAERAIIGATLRSPETLRETTAVVSEASFANPVLGVVFDVATDMWARGLHVDPVTIEAALRERGQRGIDAMALFDLYEKTPITANVGHYARLVAEAATRRSLGAFGVRVQQIANSEMPISDAMTAARGEWDAVSRTGSATLAARTLDAVLSAEDQPHDWLIPDLLERRDRLMLTGGEGGGKTTFMRQLAICAAAGVHPTTFRPCDPVRVLVVDAENNGRQWRRQAGRIVGAARRFGSADPGANVHLVTVEDMPKGRLVITDPRDAGAIHRLIDQHNPDMLVVGPLYKLSSRAITSDDDAAPLITALDGFRGRGLTLAIEAHAGHALGAGGTRDLRPRGSSALLGWPEFGIGMDRRRPADGGPADDDYRMVDLVRWRGDRETGRKWPRTVYADPRNPFPWTPENIGPATIGKDFTEGWVA